jgi:lactoylglutathione lyase
MTDDFLIQHVNVNVDNLDAAIPFYRDILGLSLDETPDQGFRCQFFKIGAVQQIHMNEIRDERQFVIDTAAWGKVRQLPNGKMQMFVRDPSGNLIEIASSSSESIDLAVFRDDVLVEPERGVYRMEPGASEGFHKTS